MSLSAADAEGAPDRESLGRLIFTLRANGVTDRRTLDAIERTPRHIFVDRAFRDRAYEDVALPIACGQTISQPSVVGLMTQALAIEPRHKVLEVGAGSGYQAADPRAAGAPGLRHRAPSPAGARGGPAARPARSRQRLGRGRRRHARLARAGALRPHHRHRRRRGRAAPAAEPVARRAA
jgi:hypothetical protein